MLMTLVLLKTSTKQPWHSPQPQKREACPWDHQNRLSQGDHPTHQTCQAAPLSTGCHSDVWGLWGGCHPCSSSQTWKLPFQTASVPGLIIWMVSRCIIDYLVTNSGLFINNYGLCTGLIRKCVIYKLIGKCCKNISSDLWVINWLGYCNFRPLYQSLYMYILHMQKKEGISR